MNVDLIETPKQTKELIKTGVISWNFLIFELTAGIKFSKNILKLPQETPPIGVKQRKTK